MTYFKYLTFEITKEIANGNNDLLVLTLDKLIKESVNLGFTKEEAKIKSKAIIAYMVEYSK